ncbi:dihydrofolate reductase family protein [Streptomyces sp. NBC_01005]|uniref:dihydrofolate reductase family protein n=1 Tax=unclassified Streptomyces TaxID=2593676 RepID=UPI002E2F078A|nr:dihydrofolate reductase family protein [Streptomyces sp. NBC_01362]WSW04495.1 dihydrofolate reductase family protein [Streptomyces sp. NBC_01005]WTC93999.1 dihydrofolate reductase family protein [Streptomyces sp. NBC_01650]
MRKIVLMASVSLDGFMEGPDREIDWHVVDDELHRHFNELLGTMGGFLEGRVTYQLMEDYWPTADSDPSATETEAEFAGIWRETPKIVFSRTLEHAGRNATIRREVDAEEIRALKAQPGGDLCLGGADLAATFMRLDLVDEYRIYVHPVLIGRGKPLFPASASRTALRLTETREFGNGVVLLRHGRREVAPAE